MPEYTPYQERIIKRYYENRQALAFQKLQELVADLYLAETEKKRESLWKRVEKAMVNLKVPAGIAEHILASRSPEALAKNIEDWWKALPKGPPPAPGAGPA